MLKLKVIMGSQQGETFQIGPGSTKIGRSQSADIQISSNRVSKVHCEISSMGSQVSIKDLNSRNGTYVNGRQIRSQRLQVGDKIILNDTVLQLCDDSNQAHNQQMSAPQDQHSDYGDNYGNSSYDDESNESGSQKQSKKEVNKDLNYYIEKVALPGVYKLASWFEFKLVLAIFLGSLIFVITVLSAIPALNMLKSSVEKESQRRTLSIAKSIAERNKQAIAQGQPSRINLRNAQNEAGVVAAIIIDQNGVIIAPVTQAGKQPDVPFLHQARREDKTQVEQINANEIGAIVPIKTYDPNTGGQSISAFSFVLYDMGAIAIDEGRTLSLYIQIFCISIIAGGIMMFFLFKLIEFPFSQINRQLDEELQNPTGNISVDFNLDSAQTMISNINSALTKSMQESSSQGAAYVDKTGEVSNIVEMIGFGAIAIQKATMSIFHLNASAEELLALDDMERSGSIENFGDQALKLNLIDLVSQSTMSPSQMITSKIDFSGINYSLLATSIMGSEEVEYVIITFIPDEGD